MLNIRNDPCHISLGWPCPMSIVRNFHVAILILKRPMLPYQIQECRATFWHKHHRHYLEKNRPKSDKIMGYKCVNIFPKVIYFSCHYGQNTTISPHGYVYQTLFASILGWIFAVYNQPPQYIIKFHVSFLGDNGALRNKRLCCAVLFSLFHDLSL